MSETGQTEAALSDPGSDALQYLQRPGGAIAYQVSGPASAPLVVCICGVGDVRSSFRLLTPKLVAAGFRVAAMDPRGQGQSGAEFAEYSSRATGEDALALVDRLGGPAVLLGHSSGAGSAVWAAAERPESVTSIILSGPFREQVALNPFMSALAAVVLRSPRLWAYGYYPWLYKGGKPADFHAYRKALRRNLSEPGRMAATRTVLLKGANECYARVPQLRVPVLIMIGSRDPDYPGDPTQVGRADERAFGEFTDTSLAILDGVGHYPHAEVPQRTLDTVLPFLQRTTGGYRCLERA